MLNNGNARHFLTDILKLQYSLLISGVSYFTNAMAVRLNFQISFKLQGVRVCLSQLGLPRGGRRVPQLPPGGLLQLQEASPPASDLKREVPSKSYQAKVPKLKFPSERSQANAPNGKLSSERSQAEGNDSF